MGGLKQDGRSPPGAWSAEKSKEVADYEIVATKKVDHGWSVADEYELGPRAGSDSEGD